MGTVLKFPTERVRSALDPYHHTAPGEIVILPVVRIERETLPQDSAAMHGIDTDGTGTGNSRRRRRARRSC